MTEDDYNQYQCIIKAAFIHKGLEDTAAWHDDGESTYKTFEDAIALRDIREPAKQIQFVDIHKFAFRAFNRLVYNREISNLLAAGSLLKLPEYYISQRSIKRINLNIFYHKIAMLLFL